MDEQQRENLNCKKTLVTLNLSETSLILHMANYYIASEVGEISQAVLDLRLRLELAVEAMILTISASTEKAASGISISND